jgi:hypothetical protein
MVALKSGAQVVMAVGLVATLTGPTPWRMQGWATFEILSFKASVRFDQSFGPAEAPPLPEPVDVLALLSAALVDMRNWSSELPADEHPLVTLRETAVARSVLVHPLAVLTVRQRVVPLDFAITRFGTARPSGDRTFHVTVSTASGPPLPTPVVLNDAFARAQFVDMTDDEKLAAPAFDQMPSGLRFGNPTVVFAPTLVIETPIVFETVVQDPAMPVAAVAATAAIATTEAPRRRGQRARAPRAVTTGGLLQMSAGETHISGGAASVAPIRHSGPARYHQPRSARALEAATR